MKEAENKAKNELKCFLEQIFNSREVYNHPYNELQNHVIKEMKSNLLVETNMGISTEELSPKTIRILDELLWVLISERKIIISFQELNSNNLKFRKISS